MQKWGVGYWTLVTGNWMRPTAYDLRQPASGSRIAGSLVQKGVISTSRTTI